MIPLLTELVAPYTSKGTAMFPEKIFIFCLTQAPSQVGPSQYLMGISLARIVILVKILQLAMEEQYTVGLEQ